MSYSKFKYNISASVNFTESAVMDDCNSGTERGPMRGQTGNF